MFPKEKFRIGATLGLTAILVMAVTAPAGAAGWDGAVGEVREVAGRFMPRILAWLDLAPRPEPGLKCDQGPQGDPNGCPKAGGQGMQSNGAAERTEYWARIGPKGRI
jgi:hypothetical protein